MVTIAFAVLTFSAFLLFLLNADRLIHEWMGELRIMAYLERLPPGKGPDLSARIRAMDGVMTARYISRQEGLKRFREKLGAQSSLLDHLPENPLPDAVEIRLLPGPGFWNRIPELARRVSLLDGVADVEYGRQWLHRLFAVLRIFRLTAFGLGILFFPAAVFFTANTVRLILHARQEEIEIMRLVGASDAFIKDPFYLQSLFTGGAGGALGLAGLAAAFHYFVRRAGIQMVDGMVRFEFLPPQFLLMILTGSVLIGWFGCFISLRQFLRRPS